jgi:hypothetical protein
MASGADEDFGDQEAEVTEVRSRGFGGQESEVRRSGVGGFGGNEVQHEGTKRTKPERRTITSTHAGAPAASPACSRRVVSRMVERTRRAPIFKSLVHSAILDTPAPKARRGQCVSRLRASSGRAVQGDQPRSGMTPDYWLVAEVRCPPFWLRELRGFVLNFALFVSPCSCSP